MKKSAGPVIPPSNGSQAGKSRPLFVMVIDDHVTVAEVLRRILEAEGNRPVVFENGPAALAALHDLPWDLVCTDIDMPDLSGWDVTLAVTAALPQVPVVVVTGWSDTYDPGLLEQRGVHSVLSKPFQVREIRSLLSKIRKDLPA